LDVHLISWYWEFVMDDTRRSAVVATERSP
jgi:hypothetical protein